jgi:quercetin dioxygenase-like cupin family protein
MKTFRNADSSMRPADASTFAGQARTKLLAASEEGAAVHMYRVEFEAGGRTNWHRHSGAQWLFVSEGRIRVQCWGQAVQDVGAGDAVMFAPGEKHWHGAVPGGHGTHIAVNVNARTEWLEPVSDEQYSSTPQNSDS